MLESTCMGTQYVGEVTVPFTSFDLDGSGSGPHPRNIPPCYASPQAAVDVRDLGIWAAGLAPKYDRSADYNCSGAPLDLLDLSLWAGAFGAGCDGACP